MLWGLYHGLLLVAHRTWRGFTIRRPDWIPSAASAIGRGVFMFVLANVGWLLFRETNFHYLTKYLAQNPFAADQAQIEAGAYLFLTVLTFSWPLFLHDWLVAWTGNDELVLPSRDQSRTPAHEIRAALTQGLVAGRAADGDSRAPQPRVAGLHLLRVLSRAFGVRRSALASGVRRWALGIGRALSCARYRSGWYASSAASE